MDGWKTSLSFWSPAYFQGWFVSFWEGSFYQEGPPNNTDLIRLNIIFCVWRYLQSIFIDSFFCNCNVAKYRKKMTSIRSYLDGSFNPFEKYVRQIGSFPQGSGWKKKGLKSPPSYVPRHPGEYLLSFGGPGCLGCPRSINSWWSWDEGQNLSCSSWRARTGAGPLNCRVPKGGVFKGGVTGEP